MKKLMLGSREAEEQMDWLMNLGKLEQFRSTGEKEKKEKELNEKSVSVCVRESKCSATAKAKRTLRFNATLRLGSARLG